MTEIQLKRLAYDTPVRTLNQIAIGDMVRDEYDSQGRVVKIIKNQRDGIVEFHFQLDSKQVIYIMGEAI